MKSFLPQDWASFKSFFEIDHKSLEEKVGEFSGSYKGLDPRALYTTIDDFLEIFTSSNVQGRWIDLGAGMGQSAVLYGALFPDREAIAIEKSSERLSVGVRAKEHLSLQNVWLITDDLETCSIPDGDTYFLYFPTGPILDRILFELSLKSTFRLVIIESHGDLIPRLKKENWLIALGQINLSSPRHYPEALIFEKQSEPQIVGPHSLSFKRKYLLIEDSRSWIGDSYGLEWLENESYQLLHPPRTIQWPQVKNVFDLEELLDWVQLMVRLRPMGVLEIATHEKKYFSEIRKISINPSFEVEISSGEWVKWSDITQIHWKGNLCYDSFSHYSYCPPVRP